MRLLPIGLANILPREWRAFCRQKFDSKIEVNSLKRNSLPVRSITMLRALSGLPCTLEGSVAYASNGIWEIGTKPQSPALFVQIWKLKSSHFPKKANEYINLVFVVWGDYRLGFMRLEPAVKSTRQICFLLYFYPTDFKLLVLANSTVYRDENIPFIFKQMHYFREWF